MDFSCPTTILIGPPGSYCKVVKIVKIYKIKLDVILKLVLTKRKVLFWCLSENWICFPHFR